MAQTAPSPNSSRPPPPPKEKGLPPPQSLSTSHDVFAPPPGYPHRSTKGRAHILRHTSSHTGLSDTSKTARIIGLALTGFIILALVTICITCARRKKKRQKAAAYYTKPPPGSMHEHVVQFTRPEMKGIPVGVGAKWGSSKQFNIPLTPKMSLPFNMTHFSYNELTTATDGFSQSNLLGEGGFGYVHKGILANGNEVAVKRLKPGSNQGEREFQAEVETISRVHHRHLVSLVGYCIADAQRMLVYEFLSNKTLDFHLHGKNSTVMKWEIRMRIALGSARGLAYLHEDCNPRIIHRDIKSSNILLDDNFEAKVADFGLAKLASGDDTHISTRVMGTFGYLAPEYASSGKLTEKSDVFSFGVMLLELLTGRKPIDPTSNSIEDSLVNWAGPLLAKVMEDGNYTTLVDPRLDRKYEPNEVARMVSCAAASIRHSAKRRPKMSQIVRALEVDGSLDALNDTLKPQRTESILSVNQSSDTPTTIVYDTMTYTNDMRRLDMEMSSEKPS